MRLSADIAATPEEVFDLYMDPSRRAEWNPEARRITLDAGAMNQVGSRYSVDTRFGVLNVEILEIDRPHLYRLRERNGRMESESTIRFEPLPDRGCRLTADVSFKRSAFFGWIAWPFVAAGGRWWARGELGRLKAVAERDSGLA